MDFKREEFEQILRESSVAEADFGTMVSLAEIANELYELKKREVEKLPYQVNLIDELHAN